MTRFVNVCAGVYSSPQRTQDSMATFYNGTPVKVFSRETVSNSLQQKADSEKSPA